MKYIFLGHLLNSSGECASPEYNDMKYSKYLLIVQIFSVQNEIPTFRRFGSNFKYQHNTLATRCVSLRFSGLEWYFLGWPVFVKWLSSSWDDVAKIPAANSSTTIRCINFGIRSVSLHAIIFIFLFFHYAQHIAHRRKLEIFYVLPFSGEMTCEHANFAHVSIDLFGEINVRHL